MLSRFSPVRFLVTLWTVALQSPLSTGFSRQEYWSAEPFPSLGCLPDPGSEPESPTASAFFFFLLNVTQILIVELQ